MCCTHNQPYVHHISYLGINLVIYFLSSSSNYTILPEFTILFRPTSLIVASIILPKSGTSYPEMALSSPLTSSYYGTLDAVLAPLNNHRQHPAWLPSHCFLGLQYFVFFTNNVGHATFFFQCCAGPHSWYDRVNKGDPSLNLVPGYLLAACHGSLAFIYWPIIFSSYEVVIGCYSRETHIVNESGRTSKVNKKINQEICVHHCS